MKSVLVMMSTYNGAKYLREQLDSLLCQENVEVYIYIRDDGSSDNTVDIIKEYSEKNSCIDFEVGENLGYAKSFWTLFTHENKYDYYAFADQDDVWHNDKLYKAVEFMEKGQTDVPLLYTSDVISVNDSGETLNKHTFGVKESINFYQSLQKSILPGCTFVFNNSAFSIIQKFNGYMESHDWAVYCIVSAFGKVLFDQVSHINYRIHESNAIGKSSTMQELLVRAKRFFAKSKCVRSKFSKDFYDCYKEDLTNASYKNSVYNLGYYKENRKKELFFDKNFKGIIFKIYVILNRV